MTARIDTGLWHDLMLTPGTITATTQAADGFDDVAALRELVPLGLEGAILGKALYAGAFTLTEALDVAGR